MTTDDTDNLAMRKRQGTRKNRTARRIRIQEVNEIADCFNTKGEFSSDCLPTWFQPLQPIVEDAHFTNMTIAIQDTHYLISLADADPRIPGIDMEVEPVGSYQEVETAIHLLAGHIIHLRTELLVIKGMLRQLTEERGES